MTISRGLSAWQATGPGEVRQIEVSPGAVEVGQARIDVAYLGLCGTDLELIDGHSPLFAMGKQSYPFVFGHEWSGTIAELGSPTPGLSVGDRVVGHPFVTCGVCVFCHGGHLNQCSNRSELGVWGTVPGAAAHSLIVPVGNLRSVPSLLSLRDATLAEPTVTVLAAINATNPLPHETVAVVGSGTLGHIACDILRHRGVEPVTISDRAAALGVPGAVSYEDAPLEGFHVILEFSSTARITSLMGDLIRPGGRIALGGFSGERPGEFPRNELVLKSIVLYGILHGIEHYEEALYLLESGAIRADSLVDDVCSFDEVPTALNRMRSGDRVRPKIMVSVAGEKL